MGVSPGRDTGCAEGGCFPGRDCTSAEDGCSPDEMVVIIGLLLYMIGLSANSQEVLCRYINVLLNYYCI